MKETPTYFLEITYLRAFAILAVISIHASEYLPEMDQINLLTFLYMSIDTFSHFAIPLFVFISGFVLYNKYNGEYSVKEFYKKRLKSVVPEYFIFSALGIMLAFIGLHVRGRVVSPDIENMTYLYSIGERIFFLWFFLLIIELYLLYPPIERVFTKFNEKNRIFGFLLLLLITQVIWHIYSLNKPFSPGNVTVFIGYLFYFVLGMYARSRYLNVKKKIGAGIHFYTVFLGLLIITVVGIAVDDMTYFNPDLFPQFGSVIIDIYELVTPFYYMIIFSLCLLVAIRITGHTQNRTDTTLQVIGKYSFGIYLIHGFFLFLLVSILFPAVGFGIDNWLFYPIVLLLTLLLSLGFIKVVLKIPCHEYIIGDVR